MPRSSELRLRSVLLAMSWVVVALGAALFVGPWPRAAQPSLESDEAWGLVARGIGGAWLGPVLIALGLLGVLFAWTALRPRD